VLSCVANLGLLGYFKYAALALTPELQAAEHFGM